VVSHPYADQFDEGGEGRGEWAEEKYERNISYHPVIKEKEPNHKMKPYSTGNVQVEGDGCQHLKNASREKLIVVLATKNQECRTADGDDTRAG